MKHVIIKHRYGFFNLDYTHKVEALATSKRKLFGLEFKVEIYADNKLVCIIDAETEDHAKRLIKTLDNAIKDGDTAIFLI